MAHGLLITTLQSGIKLRIRQIRFRIILSGKDQGEWKTIPGNYLTVEGTDGN